MPSSSPPLEPRACLGNYMYGQYIQELLQEPRRDTLVQNIPLKQLQRKALMFPSPLQTLLPGNAFSILPSLTRRSRSAQTFINSDSACRSDSGCSTNTGCTNERREFLTWRQRLPAPSGKQHDVTIGNTCSSSVGSFLKKTNGLDGAAVLVVHFPFEINISWRKRSAGSLLMA